MKRNKFNNRRLQCFVLFLLHFVCSWKCLAESAYEKSPYRLENEPKESTEDCSNPEIRNLNIVPNAERLKVLNQGKTGTCYAHSAHLLLQNLVNNFYGEYAPQISLLDTLGSSCDGRFVHGGKPDNVLLKLRDQRLVDSSVDEPHIQHIMELQDKLDLDKSDVLNNRNDYCQKSLSLLENLKPLPASVVKNMESLLEILNKNESLSLHQALKKVAPLKKVLLPKFEVINVEKSKEHPNLKEDLDNILTSSKVPIVLGFKTSSLKESRHAVGILGSRELCCQLNGEINCQKEWLVHNSYGENSKFHGWFNANRLEQYSLKFSYVVPSENPIKQFNLFEDIEGKKIFDLNKLEDFEAVMKIEGVDFNQKLINGKTFLQVAIENNNAKMVSLLLTDKKVHVNLPLKNGETALYLALKGQNKNIIKQLLKRNKLKVDKQFPSSKETPLHFALRSNQSSFIGPMIQNREVNLNVLDENGLSPIMLAVEKGDSEAFKLLFVRQFENNGVFSDQKSDLKSAELLKLAQKSGNTEIINFLKTRMHVPGHDSKSNQLPSLIRAPVNEKKFSVKELFEGISVHSSEISKNKFEILDLNNILNEDKSGNTLFHLIYLDSKIGSKFGSNFGDDEKYFILNQLINNLEQLHKNSNIKSSRDVRNKEGKSLNDIILTIPKGDRLFDLSSRLKELLEPI
jgi:ankyrin repeat protein